jgi:hypothetical protein
MVEWALPFDFQAAAALRATEQRGGSQEPWYIREFVIVYLHDVVCMCVWLGCCERPQRARVDIFIFGVEEGRLSRKVENSKCMSGIEPRDLNETNHCVCLCVCVYEQHKTMCVCVRLSCDKH